MPVSQARALAFLEAWKEYAPRFERLSPAAKTGFLKAQGYAGLRDLLAHVAAWWEEAYLILMATVEGRDIERKKYDFDVFNAAAVARFKDWKEADVLSHFETWRRKYEAFVKSHPQAMANRRVAAWFYAVVIAHIKEHGIGASRYETLDTLENEWAEYIQNFSALPPERQQAFLEKQGFTQFRDLVAHITGWFEEGRQAAGAILKDPSYQRPTIDTDAYNEEMVAKYGKMKEREALQAFERSRLELVELVRSLPEETLQHPEVQDWLKEDVIEHFFEHQL